MRLVAVGLSLALAGIGKLALLGLLLGSGIVVFLTVTGLSRASGDALADEIDGALGETGTYAVELPGTLGLEPDELERQLLAVAADVGALAAQVVEVLPPVRPECPPLEALGAQTGLVIGRGFGRQVAVSYGEGLPAGTRLCLDGQEVPGTSLAVPDAQQQRTFGTGVIVRPEYADVLRLSTTGPIRRRLVLTTGTADDHRDAIAGELERRLAEPAARTSLVLGDEAVILRVDQGEGIRSASEGIAIVYRLIGVGVLALGGLALLVAETIVVRQRLWLFGLVRALGGRSSHVVLLVALDVAAVVVVGIVLAVAASAAVQPILTSFAIDAFGVDVRLLDTDGLAALGAGIVAVLALATSYPAWLAVREDPAAVLERP